MEIAKLGGCSQIEKTAFWINAYNLIVIKAIVENYPINSPMDFAGFFDSKKHPVAGEKLTTELLVDTSDTLEDVREKYVEPLRNLMNIDSVLHAPPIVRFVWGKENFKGVIESLSVTYTMFNLDGTPLRAKMNLSLKEYRTVEIQVKESPKDSPDVDKSYTVLRGDTLTGIAAKVYRDAAIWRQIAKANGIRDPRRLQPGLVLNLPRLR